MFEDIQTPAYVLHVFIGILCLALEPRHPVTDTELAGLNTTQPATEAVTRKTLVVQFELRCDNIYIVYQS